MTTGYKSVEELLSGGADAWKFDNYGDTHTGTITNFMVQQQTDFEDGTPKFFANGDPMLQIVVDVDTQERVSNDDDGKRRVYVKSNMLKALQYACRNAGVKSIEPGGQITVTYTGDGERSGGKKGNPPKLYAVQYAPPSAAQAAALLGGQQPAAQPVQPQYAQPNVATQPPSPQQYPAQPATVPAHPYPTQAPAAPMPPVQQAPAQNVAQPLVPGTAEYDAMANALRRLNVPEDQIQQRLAAGQ